MAKASQSQHPYFILTNWSSPVSCTTIGENLVLIVAPAIGLSLCRSIFRGLSNGNGRCPGIQNLEARRGNRKSGDMHDGSVETVE